MEIKRQLKSLNNKTGKRIISRLNGIIAEHERHKKCYFWSPPGSASQRRAAEFEMELIFNLDGKRYVIIQEKSCSCKNVYFSTSIRINGEKKNITAVKRLLK